MKNKSNFFNKLVTLLVVLSLSGQSVAFAQAPQQQDDLRIGYNDATGKVSFIGADPSKPITIRSAQVQGLQADSRAMAMISPYAADFGLKNPSSELKLTSTDQVEGREVTRFQQVYNGVPIMGGEMIVNATDQAELLSLSAEISPDLSLDTNPSISPKQAQITALEAMSKSHQVLMDALEATNPELWIYDSRLLEPDGTPVTLVWRMEVKSRDNSLPINELVLVDAKRGAIVLNFNQIDTAWATGTNDYQEKSLSSKLIPLAAPSMIKYEDLVVDEARNLLYGADKVGNKIDVINMADLSLVSSYSLVFGAAPISLDLSPDGNELAIAQSGIGFVKFVKSTNGAMSEIPTVLSGPSTKVTDVVYGRSGILYALTDKGLHVINLAASPHSEDTTQYVLGACSDEERFGVISSDKNTLYYVTGTCCSGYNSLDKYDVSSGLVKPTLLKETHMYGTGYMKGIRLSLINDETILTTTGAVYNTSNLTPKAKNLQISNPATALAGRDFYVTLYDNTTLTADALYFLDNNKSYKLSSLNTSVIGSPGAIAATSDGNTLFVSSTGGMAKFTIGNTPPVCPLHCPPAKTSIKTSLLIRRAGWSMGPTHQTE